MLGDFCWLTRVVVLYANYSFKLRHVFSSVVVLCLLLFRSSSVSPQFFRRKCFINRYNLVCSMDEVSSGSFCLCPDVVPELHLWILTVWLQYFLVSASLSSSCLDINCFHQISVIVSSVNLLITFFPFLCLFSFWNFCDVYVFPLDGVSNVP